MKLHFLQLLHRPQPSRRGFRLGALGACGHLPALAACGTFALAGSATAATTYSWNNTGAAWETSTDWTPNTPAGGPTAADTASFDPTTPNASGALFNPTINAADTALTLSLNNNYLGGNYSFTGAGTLTLGSSTVTGLTTRGFGTSTINIGGGTSASLILNGPTTSGTGNINVGTDTTLVLTGNTIATVTGTANEVVVRGGDLVLDNTVGGANTAHLATTGTIQLNGGGSTLELRGNSAGTNFGTFGPLGAAGAGDTTLRTVQSGTGALSVTFSTLTRANTSGIQYFENIGTGFVGATGGPTIALTTTPITVTGTGGLISSNATTVLPYAIVTNRATNTPTAVVTGRWAAYNAGTVGAVATTNFAGDFSTAAANANVLFNPAGGSATTLAATTPALASVVFEPTGSGATLALGANKIVTSGLLLSGGNDLTVTGTGQIAGNGTGTESVSVLSPGTSLITSDVLSTATTTTGGAGFLVLNGTTNQIPFTATGNFNLGGGTLRVTSSSFVLNTTGTATPANTAAPTLRLRGGVIEYDVSTANYTFANALGTGAGNVTWTSASPATSNAGGGGFSAYSTTAGNTLTVNLGGASAGVQWDTANFVPDGYALKFGSTKSNAMVNFQNPLALDGGTAGNYNAREINVTAGVGGDGTTLSGVVSGSTSTDLLKSGTGSLTLSAVNTYAGRTLVEGGTLVVASTGNINLSPRVQVTAGALTLNNNTALSDTGALSMTSGTTLNLNAASGNETIGTLVLDGTLEPANTYSAAQLSMLDPNINFSSLNGEQLVVAVPEPATVLGGVLMVGLLGWSQRRRFVV